MPSPRPGTPAHDLRTALGATDPAQALAAVDRLRTRLDLAERDAVATMRLRGDSWQQIAAATGVTRQAAHKRWGSLVALDALAPEDAHQERPQTGQVS